MRNTLVIFSSLVSLLFLCSFEKGAPPAAAVPPAPLVTCVAAVKENVSKSFEFIAQTVAEDSVTLVPMVEGYLIKQCFDEGSMVKKGDLLFEIDPRPFEAQVKNAEGQVVAAKAQLRNANIEYERYSTLIKESATAQKDQDMALMKKGNAEGQLLIAEASLDTAKINLGYTKITAPFDGKISVCPFSVGNLVGQGTNKQALTTIMRLEPMKVEFNVPEMAIATIMEKYKSMDAISKYLVAKLMLPNGSVYPHDGAIYFTDNQITSNTGTIKQRARFPNPDALLLPGEYVKIRLEVSKKSPAILIPQVALIEDITGTLVMIVKDGKVERRQVKTGQTYGTNIEVTSGVAEGDLVITEGILKIRPGMTVNVKLAVPAVVPSAAAPAMPVKPAKE